MMRISHFGALLLAALPLLAGCGEDEPAAPPDAPLTTIAEAREKAPGTIVKVDGYVTVAPLTFYSATGEGGFAIQDDTAGVYVSLLEPFSAPLDTKLRVLGVLEEIEGQTVIDGRTQYIEKLAEPAKTITPKEIKTGDLGEALEGTLVRVTGTVSQAAMDDKDTMAQYGVISFLDDGTGEARIYVHINTKEQTPLIDTTKLVVGASITVTGFAQQFGTTYEIAPRKADDLVVN